MNKKIKKIKKNEIVFVGKTAKDFVRLIQNSYIKNGLIPEIELTFIEFAIKDNDKLQKASLTNPESLYNAMLQASESGLSLNPQWQEGYLVPYDMIINGKKVPTVKFSPMYRGKKKFLIKNNICKNITAQLVYKGELFTEVFEDGMHKITHVPNSFKRSNNNDIVGGYAVITHNNGEVEYIVKGRDYFDRVLQASKNKMFGKISPAWKNWFDMMCLKALINSADSVIPKIGLEKDTIKTLNSMNDNDIDYIQEAEEVENNKELANVIPEKEFKKLLKELKEFEILISGIKTRYDYDFTESQKSDIREAGIYNENQLIEIVNLIESGKYTLKDFQFSISKELQKDIEIELSLNEVQKEVK